jgi:hypothetical protein
MANPATLFCPVDEPGPPFRPAPFTIDEKDFNCYWYTFCRCPGIQADPDIAGIGVRST